MFDILSHDTSHNVVNRLIGEAVSKGASDIHITTNKPGTLRLRGELIVSDSPLIEPQHIDDFLKPILSDAQHNLLHEQRSLDIGYSLQNQRFRINIFFQRGTKSLAIRRLDNTFHTLKELHLPTHLERLTRLPHGLVIVTGATGSGKSTTLATLLNQINSTRNEHIITIEDPIEYVYEDNKSLVHQRELYSDVPDFASALRASLREDPDVIMVGEMRDLDTIRAALTAAETGHLVFSTLHTNNATGSIERMISAFPAQEQSVARFRIAASLRCVIAQQLIKPHARQHRIPVTEILMVTRAVSSLIEQNKIQQIHSCIESGTQDGMQTWERSLASLTKSGLLDHLTARHYAPNPESFERLIQREG